VARADGCPALDDDGGVEVGTLLDLPGLPRGSSLATHEIRHRVGIDEFTSLAAEIELFADRELQLEPVEIEVWLRPGELLVFDNLALAHGRRGTRQPGELNQRVFGTRPYRSGSSSGSATDS
jgi:hypothetical protein